LNIYKIQKGVNCWLKCDRNYFSKNKYWTGKYHCTNNECSLKYEAEASLKSDSSVELKISWYTNNSNPHEKILSKLRVSGEQRMEQKLLVAANGVTNTRVENLNFNFNNTNPSKYNLLNI
jgi:hypothetical protein